MALNIDLKRFAAYYIVGYGTEVQYRKPYSLGNAEGNSGWSLGITQIDLSKRSDARTQLAAGYATWRASHVNQPTISASNLETIKNQRYRSRFLLGGQRGCVRIVFLAQHSFRQHRWR